MGVPNNAAFMKSGQAQPQPSYEYKPNNGSSSNILSKLMSFGNNSVGKSNAINQQYKPPQQYIPPNQMYSNMNTNNLGFNSQVQYQPPMGVQNNNFLGSKVGMGGQIPQMPPGRPLASYQPIANSFQGSMSIPPPSEVVQSQQISIVRPPGSNQPTGNQQSPWVIGEPGQKIGNEEFSKFNPPSNSNQLESVYVPSPQINPYTQNPVTVSNTSFYQQPVLSSVNSVIPDIQDSEMMAYEQRMETVSYLLFLLEI